MQVETGRARQLILVLLVGFGLRLLFGLLIGGTYDYDEFVLLLLGRDAAHGAVPYHNFMFFHPPGIIMLLRSIEPLTSLWWPGARVLMIVVDTITVGLVWRLAVAVYDQRTALFAGLLYAISPLGLISAVRVGQDPFITALVMGGLTALVVGRGKWSAVLAGACLGAAIWFKYPAAIFLPVYLLAAPRRAALWLPAALLTGILLFLPFLPQAHQLYQDTVVFQQSRWAMEPGQRAGTLAVWWIGLNILAIPALLFRRPPAWMIAGFLSGAIFIIGSQVYYHYFVPTAPFAALLAAPLVASWRFLSWKWLVGAGAALTLVCAAVVQLGGSSPLYVTSAHLSDIQPTVDLIERDSRAGSPVLGDRYEYAYLSGRPALAHYFWNVGVLVNAAYLEKRVAPAGAVVMSHGASSGYPTGFVSYLNRRYRRIHTGPSVVWFPAGRNR